MLLAVLALMGTLDLSATNADRAPATQPTKTQLEKAAESFKTLTEAMGVRSGQTMHVEESKSTKPVWHGRLYENFRNDFLDAIPHEIKQRDESNSLLRRNQFGFSVSGPLIIPHVLSARHGTFFSLSYEGVREHISRTLLTTVPTVAQRSGDFSQVVDSAGNPLAVYDPTSTRANPAFDASQDVSTTNLQYLRDRLPGNAIPPSRMDPQALASLALYPTPNANAGPYFQNNYFVSSPATNTADGMLSKIDQQFGPRHRLTFNFNFSTGLLGSPRWFPTDANPGSPDQTFHYRHADLHHVFTLSPSTVNTASIDFDRRQFTTETADGGAFPVYTMSPYIGFGTASPYGKTNRTVYTLDEGLTTRRGGHYISLLAEYVARQVNTFSPQYPSGDFNFSSGITSLPGIVNTGDPFASFLLGLSDFAQRTYIPQPSYFRNSYTTLSAQDKYEVAKTFTVTVGLKFNRRTPRREKYDRQSTVNPSVLNPANGLPGALSFAGTDGVPAGLRPTSFSADPSLSFAWSPFKNMRTAVRGGYSRTHVPVPIYNAQWATQGFTARPSIVSANNQLVPAALLNGGAPAPNALPDLHGDAANGAVADWLDLTAREPTYQTASLTIERQLPFSLVLAAGAYYSGARELLVSSASANPNAINPSALAFGNLLYNQSFANTLRPYPNYTSFDLSSLYPIGRYQRDAGFIRFEKRVSNGLSASAYYEYGKQFDDYSGTYGIQDFFNRQNDWAQSSAVPHQSIQLSYVYELPIGGSKSIVNLSGWEQFLAGNWSISGRVYLDGGSPLAIHPEFNNTGGVITGLTANTVPGVDPAVSHPSPNLWFNPAAFDQPADFTLGDASRTAGNVLGPGVHTFDTTLVKRIETGKDTTVEFTATAFNVFNHGDWNLPDTAIGSATTPNTNAGRIIGSHGGRVIQLGLSFNF